MHVCCGIGDRTPAAGSLRSETVHVEPVIILGTESEGVSVVDVGGLHGSAPERALVQVSANGLRATQWVVEYPDFRGLVKYFTDLERRWRGWRGTKTWISLEGDLAFTATHSGSHVNFSMRVESHSDWKLQVELSIGAGEDLSAARAEVARLFER